VGNSNDTDEIGDTTLSNHLFFDNFLTNLPGILAGTDASILASALRDKNVPAIIVGAGPSLDKQIPLLLQSNVEKTSAIISTDAAYIPLLYAGILPDFVVTTDPQPSTQTYLNTPERRPILVYEGGCNPAVVNFFDRRLSMFAWGSVSSAITRAINPDKPVTQVAGWGSVLNMAVGVSEMMGFNPIILVGADLAFTDGRFYCSRFPGSPALQLIVPIADLHGQLTHSNLLFVSYAKWLEAQLINYQSTIINSTEGGILRLKRNIPLKAVIDRYCKRPFTISFKIPAEDSTRNAGLFTTWKAALLDDLACIEAAIAAAPDTDINTNEAVQKRVTTWLTIRHLSVEDYTVPGFYNSISWLRERVQCLN
jgi:hypothetical protein